MLRNKSRRFGAGWRRGAFVGAACATGFTSGWRFARRYSIPILTYHGISARPADGWSPLRTQVSASEFQSHLGALARHYEFVSLDTAIGVLSGRLPRRPNCVVLTFDDGYRNNLTEALPILASFAAPATIFLPVGHIAARRPLWFDRLDYALQSLNGRPFRVQVAMREFDIEPNNRAALRSVFGAIRDYAKRALSDAELQTTMARLAEELEGRAGRDFAAVFESDAQCGLINWDDVRANCGGLITFGSHTVDHVRLTRIAAYEARDQLARSRAVLMEITGAECRAIAYPNGDWDGRIAQLAAECGYEAGLTSDEGLNGSDADLLALRRIGIGPGLSESEVLFRASGLSKSVSQLVNPSRSTSDDRHNRCAV